jgi:enediyne biosynthesis protein E3
MPASELKGSQSVVGPLHRLLGLSIEEASFRKRGFTESDPLKQRALEAIGQTFIGGYNSAISAGRLEDVAQHIETVAAAHRGFAAEGAAMGYAIADALPLRTKTLAGYIARTENEFSYLTHVGAGWALARVPWRRARILAPLDPIHYWLAYDGLGFHDGYFYHRRVLAGWRRHRSGYAARAYDQGIGRALWFVAGGSVAGATDLMSGFAAARQDDLWSGLGLAMTYAGPANAGEINAALRTAGEHGPQFSQGVAFACEARALGRHIPAHTDAAAAMVCGCDAEDLAKLVRDARKHLAAEGADAPPYEIWRRKVVAAISPMMEPVS